MKKLKPKDAIKYLRSIGKQSNNELYVPEGVSIGKKLEDFKEVKTTSLSTFINLNKNLEDLTYKTQRYETT